jgi:hypothetical protein
LGRVFAQGGKTRRVGGLLEVGHETVSTLDEGLNGGEVVLLCFYDFLLEIELL